MFRVFLVFIFSIIFNGCISTSPHSSVIVPFQNEITDSQRYAFNESNINFKDNCYT